MAICRPVFDRSFTAPTPAIHTISKYFVRFSKDVSLTILSTMTEREGKHEQETDNNARNSRNGRSGFRTPGTWRTSSSSRPEPSPSRTPPSSSLRMGRCRRGHRNGGNRTQYRGSAASRCRACTSCGGSSASCRPATSACGCHPRHNSL